MDRKSDYLDILEFRYACKLFDSEKKIDKNDLRYILEAARLSPSSFGMEPWKFLVVQNQELKSRLKPFCWNQEQITSCSDLVIILAKIDDIRANSEYVKNKFARRELPKEKFEAYLKVYENHLKDMSDECLFAWSSKQCYIALSNILNSAASLGIDSCPIEGFEAQKVEELLQIDSSKYKVAVIAALGYRKGEKSDKLRDDFDTLIEYIN